MWAISSVGIAQEKKKLKFPAHLAYLKILLVSL
jgi:hypothetical protein